MNIDDTIERYADMIAPYAQPLLFGAGAIGAVIGVVLVWRFFRTGHAHTRVGLLAVVLATAFAAEGMWEVATGPMGLPPLMAAGLFGMFEVVMVSQGLLAKHKLAQDPPGDVRRHMNFVWAVAAASGIVASTASNSVPEFLLRLCAPAVGAGIWWMGITADRPAAAVQTTSWIWTPRRIGIRLGLVQPGEQDLVKVDRDRRIDAITVTAHRLHHGSPGLARRRKAKLRRLALQADDAMVAEAQRRVARVNRIERLTSPDFVPVAHSVDALGDPRGDASVTHPLPVVTRPVDAARDAAPDAPAPIPTTPAQPALTRIVTQADALPRRTREVVMRRPVSAPPGDRDSAMAQALDAVLTRGESIRGAARDADVPEATLRRAVQARRDAARINGHEFEVAKS